MKEKIIQAALGGQNVPVHVVYRNNRNMYLRIERDGSLVVSCGRWVSDSDIISFLYQKESWILKHQMEVSHAQSINREGIDGDAVWWLGAEKKVRFISGRRNFCWVDGDLVTFELREKNDETIRKAFRSCAARTLKILIDEKRGQWDEEICIAHHLPLPEISIRYMTSRWGVCYPAKSRITISSRLIHYREECLDYVLLHEYVHFLVQNHSGAFYEEVRKHMPEYADYEKLLK